ncbi:hypothetical protein NDU88_006317 [Pleurodeles waltl]|uniref:Uncharacterized protein n=1 Tax=Pleurodeles waltl TaxID=8319 RepID=A0AAV7SPE9_PLEWA|nr:hypothetical protein NDU88_006317 [Pleurodeles waltl]
MQGTIKTMGQPVSQGRDQEQRWTESSLPPWQKEKEGVIVSLESLQNWLSCSEDRRGTSGVRREWHDNDCTEQTQRSLGKLADRIESIRQHVKGMGELLQTQEVSHHIYGLQEGPLIDLDCTMAYGDGLTQLMQGEENLMCSLEAGSPELQSLSGYNSEAPMASRTPEWDQVRVRDG